MPRDHGRLQPFQVEHGAARERGRACLESSQTSAHRSHQGLGATRRADQTADLDNVCEQSLDGVWRQRNDASPRPQRSQRGALDLHERHGAHAAGVLREHERRLQLGESYFVHRVDAEPLLNQAAYLVIDGLTLEIPIEPGGGEHGFGASRGGEVALVRHAHHGIAQTQRVTDLRGTREQ